MSRTEPSGAAVHKVTNLEVSFRLVGVAWGNSAGVSSRRGSCQAPSKGGATTCDPRPSTSQKLSCLACGMSIRACVFRVLPIYTSSSVFHIYLYRRI